MRRWYGAGPLHLLVMLFALALAAVAVLSLGLPAVLSIGLWLVGAAVLHDLLLVPVYSVLDRGLVAALHRRRSGVPRKVGPTGLNYVRVPAAFSLLLLGMFFPLVLALEPVGYPSATNLPVDVYLGRYLALVAGMCAVSLVLFGVRAVLAARGPAPIPSPAAPEPAS